MTEQMTTTLERVQVLTRNTGLGRADLPHSVGAADKRSARRQVRRRTERARHSREDRLSNSHQIKPANERGRHSPSLFPPPRGQAQPTAPTSIPRSSTHGSAADKARAEGSCQSPDQKGRK